MVEPLFRTSGGRSGPRVLPPTGDPSLDELLEIRQSIDALEQEIALDRVLREGPFAYHTYTPTSMGITTPLDVYGQTGKMLIEPQFFCGSIITIVIQFSNKSFNIQTTLDGYQQSFGESTATYAMIDAPYAPQLVVNQADPANGLYTGIINAGSLSSLRFWKSFSVRVRSTVAAASKIQVKDFLVLTRQNIGVGEVGNRYFQPRNFL